MKKISLKKNKLVNPEYWVLPNRKKFVEWIDETFKNKDKIESEYFPHQEFIRNYFQIESPYRGILLYHSLGSGKSCSSILIAESFMNDKKVIVFLPASLEKNYIKELKKCGNKRYRIDKNYWRKNNLSKMVNKYGGIWEIIENKESNISELNNNEIKEINFQINEEIKKNYQFIHYNGLNKNKINEFENNEEYFDNKLIIVDEVHNLISMMTGSGEIGLRLYKLFMNSKNTRFVFLSGTPIINSAFELSYLFNILRGYIITYTITLNKIESNEELYSNLYNIPFIDQIFTDYKNKKIIVTENTFSFENYYLNNNYMGVTSIKSKINFQKYLYNKLDDVKSITQTKYTCLPDNEEEFDKKFIKSASSEIKNDIILKKRILGLVSYFKNQDKVFMPSIKGEHIIKCPMSGFQTHIYINMRSYEIEKEMKFVKKKKDTETNNINTVFRVFSRQCCNFVFPDEIKRPFPTNIKKDDIEEFKIEQEERSKKNIEFQIKKEEAYIKLKNEKYNYLTLEKIETYSNKFKQILLNINTCPGTCFIYSQFRKLEGIGIFSLVLEANGYCELKLNKNEETNEWEVKSEFPNKPCFSFYTGEEMVEKREIIKDIFNNDIPEYLKPQLKDKNNLYGNILKVLLVTSSAAEGINLRNVRQVHIMEPYWNPVRLEQVKGRAIRYKSHVELPEKDRNVEIFEYHSVIEKKDIENIKHIYKRDKGLTSDEIVKNIAQEKKDINNSFLTLIKESSIDCNINDFGDEKLNCINFGDYYTPYSYNPNINTDENNIGFNTFPGVLIKYKNNTYILNKKTNDIYNYEEYQKGRPKKIGIIKDNKIIFDIKK